MRISKFCCRNSESNLETRTPLFQRFSCGVGSVILDLTRQLLFSFRLVFFMNVLGLSAANAGWLMLYGKLVRAVTSPISALLHDRIDVPFLSRKIGRRKSWHLIGTMLLAIFFPLFFSSCFPCQSDRGQWQLMIYIPVLNTISALSFSIIEIGHLSIIPNIAKDQGEAIELNAWRGTFTSLSGFTTLVVAWAIFGQDSSDQLSAEDSMDFTVMTLILVGIGLVFSLIFHVGTKEISHGLNNGQSTKNGDTVHIGENLPISSKEASTCNGRNCSDETNTELSNDLDELNSKQRENGIGAKPTLASSEPLGVDNKGLDCNEITVNNGGEVLSSNLHSDSLEVNPGASNDPESVRPVTPATKTFRAWLKNPNLYKVAIIFACTIVIKDVSYAYLPLFLIYKIQIEKDAIAYLPLIMLVSAAVSSAISKKLIGIIGSKCLFILSAFFVIGAGLWFYFITQSNKVMIFPAVVLLGFGFSAMLVNALSFAAEFIGNNKSTSGVVFGVMTLMAQFTGGVLISTIQKMFPKGNNSEDCEECVDYVRHVFSFVPGSLAAASVLVVLLSQTSQIIRKRKVPETDTSVNSDGTIDTRF